MSKVSIELSTLTNIGDAIREKKGTTEEIAVTELGNEIRGIQSGGESAKGLIWLEVNEDGYPIKVDASTIFNTYGLFRYSDYKYTEEIILPTDRNIETYYMCYEKTNLKKINLPTDAKYYANCIATYAFIGCKSLTLADWQIPEGITDIAQSAFESAESLTDRIIPSTVKNILAKAFNRCYAMRNVLFKGTPTTIANNAFAHCNNLTDIYCPFAEGAIANAPWGATNATIHYNYVEGE